MAAAAADQEVQARQQPRVREVLEFPLFLDRSLEVVVEVPGVRVKPVEERAELELAFTQGVVRSGLQVLQILAAVVVERTVTILVQVPSGVQGFYTCT